MSDNIISKFTTATEDGIEILHSLTAAIAREKFTSVVPTDVLEQYVSENFNRATLIVEMNSMSNQWIVVYVNKEPTGYARITSKGKKPQTLEHKRIIRLADFGILQKYADVQIAQSLFDKCFSVCRGYDGIWINEYSGHPLIDFFKKLGFTKLDEVPVQFELPLSAVYFFKEKEK